MESEIDNQNDINSKLENLEKENSALKVEIEELKDLNDNLERFASIISHDLKEPLRTISGFISLLEPSLGKKMTEEEADYFGYIKDAASRMSDMIKDILDYSHTGDYHGNEQVIDLNVLLHEHVYLHINESAKENKSVVKIRDLPTVRANENAILRIFQNLVSNGLKYHLPDTPPFVEVGYREIEGFYEFYVKDNGVGIRDKYKDYVFEPLSRLVQAHKIDGTGMGLSICKRIIGQIGGKIWLESEEGKGTTFFFTIKK